MVASKQCSKDHVEAEIDKTQQNSNCRLCGEGDEMMNHIISK